MKLKNIPICAITDENLTFTVPALFISILENSSEDYFYRFYCFVNHKVSDEDRNKICAIQDSYENCSVEIVDMGRTYQDCINRHPTVTNACLYKFAIINSPYNLKVSIFEHSSSLSSIFCKRFSYFFNVDKIKLRMEFL